MTKISPIVDPPNRKMAYGPDLAFDGVNPPADYPLVSLCMIVKNEEDNLAECLATVEDFAGEIIVVDTGSTDRTVEIAQAMGARGAFYLG
jgi:cellulose synthase/poly-beta-1,6-N-acetylglucosamine synthase-like glycosyltransferase